MLAMPWLSGSLWRKITWINRLEFLWEDVDKVRGRAEYAFVVQHDLQALVCVG